MIKQFETEFGGRTLRFEIGRLAQQATQSVWCQYGDTVALATVVLGQVKEGQDYFPLQVDFEERLYAAGRIKGSRFIKREGRASDEAILTGRLIDRSIRPLFNKDLKNELQVVITILSVDQENDSDVPALLATSAALALSDIPWDGPIAGIRIGRVENEFVLNPTYEARIKSDLDLFVAGTAEKILMIEAGAEQISENNMQEAMEFGLKHLGKLSEFIRSVQKEVGKPKRNLADLLLKKEEDEESQITESNIQKVHEWFSTHAAQYLTNGLNVTKKSRKESVSKLKIDLDEYLKQEQIGKEKRKKLLGFIDGLAEKEITRAILEEGKRVDGRSLDDIRTLSSEVGVLPRTHGSGLFSRGETQVLTIATLGSPGDEQTLDSMEEVGKKRYMHHYNFPGYSVGEVKRMMGPGRREIGHGALAEKALLPVIPTKEEFPYTIRLVSEVLGSNGSSSMGSVCGSSLALMDAGIPIKEPVAGIAMGLASNEKGEYKILTDLQDLEDGEGGMDFKVAGTKNGITAIQLDTKTDGLTASMIKETLEKARDARLRILAVMSDALPQPRSELSKYAPRIVTVRINPEKIRDVIGPGGKTINEIIAATGVQIDIEQDGLVLITSVNAEASQKAIEWVERLTKEVVVGEVFDGKVTRLMDFGAFVEVLPRQEGLVHISELAKERVNKVTDVVKVGQAVKVKVIQIDDQGRINLSMKRVD